MSLLFLPSPSHKSVTTQTIFTRDSPREVQFEDQTEEFTVSCCRVTWQLQYNQDDRQTQLCQTLEYCLGHSSEGRYGTQAALKCLHQMLLVQPWPDLIGFWWFNSEYMKRWHFRKEIQEDQQRQDSLLLTHSFINHLGCDVLCICYITPLFARYHSDRAISTNTVGYFPQSLPISGWCMPHAPVVFTPPRFTGGIRLCARDLVQDASDQCEAQSSDL